MINNKNTKTNKFIAVALIASLILSTFYINAFAATSKAPSATFKALGWRTETVTSNDGNVNISINYPVTGLSSVDTYISTKYQSYYNKFNDEISSIKNSDSAKKLKSGEYLGELDIKFNSSTYKDYTSIVLNLSSINRENANSLEIIETYTFNTKTGKQIKLSDLFKTNSKYLEELSKLSKIKLKANSSFKAYYEEENVIAGLTPNQENFARFSLEQDGLHIFFNQYQVGARSAGAPTITIPYSELSKIWALGTVNSNQAVATPTSKPAPTQVTPASTPAPTKSNSVNASTALRD